MRPLSIRLILIAGGVCVVGLGLSLGWPMIRARYVLPWIGQRLTSVVEQRSGCRLQYGQLTGTLMTDLELQRARLQPVRPLGEFAPLASPPVLMADRIRVRYTPLGLLQKRIRDVEISGCRLQLGQTVLALTVTRDGPRTTISLPMQEIQLEDLRRWVTSQFPLQLHGLVRVGGDCHLSMLQPESLDVHVQGHDIGIRWGVIFTGRADADLRLHGLVSSPVLDGTVELVNGTWTGIGIGGTGSVVGTSDWMPLRLTSRFPWTMQVGLHSNRIWVDTEKLHARLRARLLLRKGPRTNAHLTGALQAINGTYSVRTGGSASLTAR